MTKLKPNRAKEIYFKAKIALAILLSCIFFSFLIYLIEKDVPHSNIKTFTDSLYFVFASISTIGWGDIVATQGLSRALIIICFALSRFVVIVVFLSAVNGWFGRARKEYVTVEDRIRSIEIAIKAQESATQDLSRDVNALVKDNNRRTKKNGEFNCYSLPSCKDFISSPFAKGCVVNLFMEEEHVRSEAPEDFELISKCIIDGVVKDVRYLGGA